MKNSFYIILFVSTAFSDRPEQLQFFKNLGDRSVFEKKGVREVVLGENGKPDFEKDAIVFRGYGSRPDWDNLPVIHMICLRFRESGAHEVDPLTSFNVIPARSVDTRIRHELGTRYSIDFDQEVRPRSVVFRVVPADYTGPIRRGVLIEGATYIFGRRHRHLDFSDTFTVPTGLQRNSVTTIHWIVNPPVLQRPVLEVIPVNIEFTAPEKADMHFKAVYLATENAGVRQVVFPANQESPAFSTWKLGGDLLIQNTKNPTREWMYIRNLQKTNVRLPQDADLVMSPETGRSVHIFLKLPENQNGVYSMAIGAHEESILPLVYSEQDEKQTREGYRRFFFYLPESEYQFHIYRKGLSTRIHTGAFQVGSDPENRITIELPPPNDNN